MRASLAWLTGAAALSMAGCDGESAAVITFFLVAVGVASYANSRRQCPHCGSRGGTSIPNTWKWACNSCGRLS
jgi:hypothetical protein